ncbi:NPCBM/NEW2 domain-containing protein [Arthrobacter sp. SO3]|uniref:NPCBM/NEW2 domain-containing protein n=1 Tax=Arthrobacter sp. SO3 TaxID=1897057 RepID=UPI0021F5D7B5|nr:NPCBM/NEW2 domain-containing protein [Arthrobacter sp. SO3]MCB5294334.1 hypothetical protein [Arthrobacter sp. SO3]
MPPLAGKTLEEATKALELMGTQPAVKRIYDPKSTPGAVLSTDPSPGSPLTMTPTLTVAGAPGSAPLSGLKGIGNCGPISSGSVNGTKVTNGLRCAVGHNPTTTYWILDRTVARLQGTIGIDDSSDTAATARITITADGKPLLDQDIAYGQSANLDADITGVLRLEVTVTETSTSKKSGTSGTTYVVLGNAVVLGSAAAIAALGGTP